MLSWRGAVGAGDAGSIRSDLGGRVILLLAIGVEDTAGASPKSVLRQQLMQITEGAHRRARSTQFHACAGGSVEHPRRHDQDYARSDLDVNHVTCRSLFAVLPSKSTTIERMPAVEDLYLLPDMGRMTPRLRSAESRGSSPAANWLANAPPSSWPRGVGEVERARSLGVPQECADTVAHASEWPHRGTAAASLGSAGLTSPSQSPVASRCSGWSLTAVWFSNCMSSRVLITDSIGPETPGP